MWVKRVLPSLLFVAITGMALAYFISHGFSARDEPMAIEAWVARQLRHIAVPRAAREMGIPAIVSIAGVTTRRRLKSW